MAGRTGQLPCAALGLALGPGLRQRHRPGPMTALCQPGQAGPALPAPASG